METPVNTQEPCCSTDKKKKCCLCSPQMIFNIVAAVLIVLLIVLQFFNPFGNKSEIVGSSDGSINIAWIESDSIMTQYELAAVLKEDLIKLNDSLDKEFSKKQENFQARVNQYQANMQNGKIQTKDDASRQEQALAAEQEQLMNLRDSYLAQVQSKQLEMNNQILDSIISVIEKYPEEFPYNFVLDYNSGSGIIYADKTLNITAKVIDKMNKEYKGK